MATAMALSLLGGTVAAAQQLPPGITLPPPVPQTTTTSTTALPATTTTVPPTTTAAPQNQTKILDGAPGAPGGPAGAPPGTSAPAATTSAPRPGDAPASTTGPSSTTTATTLPRISLSPGQVADVLRSQQRSGASSTSALVEALKPLQNLGMTMDEALALGMGRFPLLGVANWTDDWLDPRTGPPPHQHQGNDLFAAFDVPVRAPADGIVRFEDAGLGGKGAFVTTPDGTYYYMAHLKAFAKDLPNGAAVTQGQIVGYNGDSGNAKGGAPHVHFEIHPGGGAAVDPKPILDGWVAEATAKVPELIASFQPKAENGATAEAVDVPQILMSTGMTRRFSAPSIPLPGRERPVGDFNRAVLGPLTPPVLAPLLEP
ncbi:MAG TPA: M23 family metallopeptidase [Acidimicrobiales bacterium]|nr:M23 family metallopeptidase [Acidimicrobiales bacterium]